MHREGFRRLRLPALIAMLLLAAAVIVAGCGSSSSSSSSASSGGSTGEEAPTGGGEAGAGGTLKVVLAAPPASLDPTVSDRASNAVFGTILERLVLTDENTGELNGEGIITSWNRKSPTTWVMKIRKGVSFTNGEPADAEAVAQSILDQRDVEGAVLTTYFLNLKDAKAVNPTTVEVTTIKPQFNFVNNLSTVYLMPPKYYKKVGSEGFSKAPIGTGPFVFKGEKPGQSIAVSANSEYWKGPPKLEGIEFTFAESPQQRLSLVQSGAVDLAYDLPPALATQAEGSGLEVLNVVTTGKAVVFLERSQGVFTDPKLAKAAALAVNRDEIVEGIFQNGNEADGGMLNVIPGETMPSEVAPDMEEAQKLVGNSSPSVEVTYPIGNNADIDQVSQAVASQLEEAGFKAKLNPVDKTTFIGLLLGHELNGAWVYLQIPNVPDANFFVQGWMTSTSIAQNCPNPKVDALAAEALEKSDGEAAAPIYQRINTEDVVERNCYIPLYFEEAHFAFSPNVVGFNFGTLRYANFYEAGFAN